MKLSPTDQLAATFAEEILESERHLISSGWDNLESLHAVACEFGITGRSFADPTMSFLFFIICRSVELGCKVPTAEQIHEIARRAEISIPDGFYDPLPRIRSLEAGLGGIGMERYAAVVAENHRTRIRYRELLAEAQSLIPDGDRLPADPEHHEPPKRPRVRIPGRLRKGRRHAR